jgi:hypothetical protein
MLTVACCITISLPDRPPRSWSSFDFVERFSTDLIRAEYSSPRGEVLPLETAAAPDGVCYCKSVIDYRFLQLSLVVLPQTT